MSLFEAERCLTVLTVRCIARCFLVHRKWQTSSGSPKVRSAAALHERQQKSIDSLLGIILSGSPYSVYDPSAPHVDPQVFESGVPVLGICYGLQEIARTHGGKVEAHSHREYGYAKISVKKSGKKHADMLFDGIQMEDDGGLQVRIFARPRSGRGESRAMLRIGVDVAWRSTYKFTA